MQGSDIRQSFLDFFVTRDHRLFPSAPLVPRSDPTLLFINAGMVPFKSFFLGDEKAPFPRATSVQKCLRVSGKHNDLENVGPSPRHHTFFEMLGNFSFGDYFKAEAIELAWELVTGVWGLAPEHLFATVYEEDDDAFELWRKIAGLDEARIVRCGEKDNFWAMGETGPCGPCSEVHVDRLPSRPAVTWEEGSVSGRYFEIWNLVFMQYERGTDGALTPLPDPAIDTGAGLERLAAVLQEADSNYETDLFRPLLQAAGELAGVPYGSGDAGDLSLRVVADHLRAVGFLLADGVIPGNEGRGYVLRRILRRAVRHGLRLGLEEPFLYRLIPVLATNMDAYPELAATAEASKATVRTEEEKFLSTVAVGARHVQDAVEEARSQGRGQLSGEAAFRLYDTFGLPLELIREILEEEGLGLDEKGFESALSQQRERSRSATGKLQEEIGALRRALAECAELPATDFMGYDRLALRGARVLRALRRSQEEVASVDTMESGEEGFLILDRTVFYAEAGGQVGDTGAMVGKNGRAEVLDTQRDEAGLISHRIKVIEGEIAVGDELDLEVDAERRRRTERHHTATHLLHAALRRRLGENVRQAGSLVHPDRLRFDFTWDRPLDETEKEALEDDVTRQVLRAVPMVIDEKPYEQALAEGAMALFGEKYGDRVRTVEVPGFSLELCGGCHVRNTGEVGCFRIVGERGVASGVRRIEAVSGEVAESLSREERRLLQEIEEELGVPAERAAEEIASLEETIGELRRELRRLRLREVSGGDGAGEEESEVAGVKVLAKEVGAAPPGDLRTMADVLRQRLGSGVVVLGARDDDRVNLIVTVTEDLTDRIDASELAKKMGELVGGAGGGRRDFAQAGGKEAARLSAALEAAASAVEDQLRTGSRSVSE